MFTSSHDAPKTRLHGILRAGCFGSLVLICALLSCMPIAYAQTQEEEEKDPTVQQTETEAAETEQETAQETESIPLELDKPPGRFIPSEEVSEDRSVPFPTDI